MSGRSSAWGDQHGSIDRAEEVVLLSQWARSRTRVRGLRSNRATKAKTRVDRVRESKPEVEKKLADVRCVHNAPPAYIRVLQAWTDPS
jgi:hypothetical protein